MTNPLKIDIANPNPDGDAIRNSVKALNSNIEKSHDAFEKQLNYISAGSLALSMIIVEKIVKDLNNTTHNWMLVTSWFLFVLSLSSNLISHLYAAKVHSKTIVEINNGNYSNKKSLARNKIINTWNVYSVPVLITGMFLEIIFVAIIISLS